ncbi:MAG: ABC transporter permease [Alphaproteobacteria bacterium]|nr:ABC transporter permease [Alphaproteobacteria bacterium]
MAAYLFLVFFFLMLPVVVVVLASVSNTSYLVVPPRGVTFRWYRAVLDNQEFTGAILYSLRLALVTTLGSIVLGVAASYALVRLWVPGRAAISAVLMAPLAFPAVVIGVALLQFYSALGVSGSFAGLVAAHMVITVPYVVRAVLASLHGADAAVEDAARTLGANRWVAFFTVTLPLIRPGVVAGGLFAFIVSFDNVPVTIFLLDVRHVTLPVKIFTSIEYGVDPSIAAVSTMLIVATGLFLVVAERWLGFHRFV